MKIEESGMPEENYWNSLFDVPLILEWLDLKNITGSVVEVGCGYGTFTLPLARRINSELLAFDIEPDMIEISRRHIQKAGMHNVRFFIRDIIDEGTGLESGSMGMVLLFNILHFNERRVMLQEAERVLKSSGIIAIIHWRKDITTPRGPAYDLRPDEKSILESIDGLKLYQKGKSCILEPYHWGMQLIRK